jgi:hypothetical protein
VLGVDVCAQDGAVATCGNDKTIKIYRRQTTGLVNGQANGGAEDSKSEDANIPDHLGGANALLADGIESTQPTPPDTAMEEG